jgi:DNA-binding CsgD family transcriptional regulator
MTGDSSDLLEDRVITKSGQIKDVAIRASKITIEGKEVMQGIFRDITKRKQVEEALKEREKELENQTINLEEMNAALSVLLKKREADKTELEEKVLFNINQLIEPYIAKLNQSGLDERQKALAIIIESNLKEITSSFAFTLSTPHMNMTPKEIEVANLIKQGKATKEISEILGSSEKVIAFHRQNIRKKLGLLNKKVNLKSYLISKLK